MEENTADDNLDEDSELDPRIQDELEKLNKSSAQINELENQLDEIRAAFRQLFCSSTQKIDNLAKDLGSCVEKARPYYAALAAKVEAHNEHLQALNRYEKACARLSAAKEMTHTAELNAQAGGPITESIQEALNHAIAKVNDAEKEKMETIREHQQAMASYTAAEKRLKEAEDGHRRDIKKAKPYFQAVRRYNATMKEEKTRVQIYEEKVAICKSLYAEALSNLESISEDIHRRRKEAGLRRELGHRGQGVGAELEEPIESADADDDDETRVRRRSHPMGPPISSEAEPSRSESWHRRSSDSIRRTSLASSQQDDSTATSTVSQPNRPRSSHRRTRHRQRQLRISATPIVGFLAETAHAHALEAARLQQRAARHQLPVEAWSATDSADSDWGEAASIDGAESSQLRQAEAAFEAWKAQEARLHHALHEVYDGDDEDDVEELSRH